MPFDVENTARVANGSDRNVAPFFVGRAAELAHIRQGVEDVTAPGADIATDFRIIRGAPGSGKTALLRQLSSLHDPRANVIAINLPDDVLAGGYRDVLGYVAAARGSANRWSSRLRTLAEASKTVPTATDAVVPGAVIGSKVAGAVATGAATLLDRFRDSKRGGVVLLFDEAQAITPVQAATLLGLHKTGLEGIPSVCVLAGLSNTGDHLRSYPGLSRLSRGADRNIAPLSDDECHRSTRMMLAHCGIDGVPEARLDRAAAFAATLAHGWPQHLCLAQQALADALLGADGDLDKVDSKAVAEQTRVWRDRYYSDRLSAEAILKLDPRTIATIARFSASTPSGVSQGELAALATREIRKLDGDHPLRQVSGLDTVNEMFAKGILSAGERDGTYTVPIPSMLDYFDRVYPLRESARDALGGGHGC